MPEVSQSALIRLALWADIMCPIKNADMSWPGFSYTDAEWARMAELDQAVDGAATFRFQLINAVLFIVLAGLVIAGGFMPLMTLLYPNPADTKVLPFALVLAATAFLLLGAGLPLTMRIAAPLAADASLRALNGAPGDGALWAKVVHQIRRISIILCGLLVPGILIWVTFDIDGGPIITALKWASWLAVTLSTAHGARQRLRAKQAP